MRRSFALVLVGAALLTCPPLGQAENFSGPFSAKPTLEANHTLTLEKSTELRVGNQLIQLGQRVKFKGGQRASVIVMGDHDPIVPVKIEVFDDKGNLVARDDPAKGAAKSSDKGNDYAGVVWYPPRDGYYRIAITNHGKTWNKCYVAIN